MKLKVYEKTEQSMFLKLYEYPDGVELVVVNSDGVRRSKGTILDIDMEGLHLKRDINKNLGLPLNREGMLKIKRLGIQS